MLARSQKLRTINHAIAISVQSAMKTQLLFNEESYKIIGACFEVYHEKGCGFLEPVYQECKEIDYAN